MPLSTNDSTTSKSSSQHLQLPLRPPSHIQSRLLPPLPPNPYLATTAASTFTPIHPQLSNPQLGPFPCNSSNTKGVRNAN